MKQLGFYHVISMGKESLGVFLNNGDLEDSKVPKVLLEDLISGFDLPVEKVLSLETMQDVYDLCNASFIGFCGCLDTKEDKVFSVKEYVLAYQSAYEDTECPSEVKKAIYKALDMHLEELQKEENITDEDLDIILDMQPGFLITYNKETEELASYSIAVVNEEHLKKLIGEFLVDEGFIQKSLLDMLGVERAIEYVNVYKGFVVDGGLISLSDFDISLTPNNDFAKKKSLDMGAFKEFIQDIKQYK